VILGIIAKTAPSGRPQITKNKLQNQPLANYATSVNPKRRTRIVRKVNEIYRRGGDGYGIGYSC
jgi:hypothetical protein